MARVRQRLAQLLITLEYLQGRCRCAHLPVSWPRAVPPAPCAKRRRGSNSPSVFVFNSYVLVPLQLLLLQAFGHLEIHHPLQRPRPPHNPIAPLLRALWRCMRAAVGGRADAANRCGPAGSDSAGEAAGSKAASTAVVSEATPANAGSATAGRSGDDKPKDEATQKDSRRLPVAAGPLTLDDILTGES